MRWTGILTSLAILLASPLSAQQGQGDWPQPRSGRGLFRGITLSSQQQKQVDSIWKSHEADRERMRAARSPGQRSDTALMRERQQMRAAHAEEYRQVLTEEQRKAFDTNLEAMKRGGRAGRGQSGRAMPAQQQRPPGGRA